jgi:hypothetical protein
MWTTGQVVLEFIKKDQDSGFISLDIPVFRYSLPRRSNTILEKVITKDYARRTAPETSISTTNCSDSGSRSGVEFGTVKVCDAIVIFKLVKPRACLWNSEIAIVEIALDKSSAIVVFQQFSHSIGNAFHKLALAF